MKPKIVCEDCGASEAVTTMLVSVVFEVKRDQHGNTELVPVSYEPEVDIAKEMIEGNLTMCCIRCGSEAVRVIIDEEGEAKNDAALARAMNDIIGGQQ